jgi:hypothetical protein
MLGDILANVLFAIFKVLIMVDNKIAFVLESYYKIRKIPYIKQRGKFSPELIRLERKS